MTTLPPPSSSATQTIDFAKPFRFVFEDPDWLKKIAIGGLFYLLSFIIIGIFFVGGYVVEVARRVMREDARPMPEWDNPGSFFADGFKIFVVTLVYALPLVILWAISFGGMAVTGAFEEEPWATPLAGMFGCSMLLFVLVVLLYSIIIPAALVIYAATGSMGEAFNVGRVVRFIVQNPVNYLLAYLVYLVSQFLSQFGVILLCVGVIFTSFWALVISAYAFADAYRLARIR